MCMDEHNRVEFGDERTSDTVILLKNHKGKQQLFHSHSFVLKSKSTYFADRLADVSVDSCSHIEIDCTDLNYDSHLKLLKSLYLPEELLNSDYWGSVKSALGVLQVSKDLHCESIVHSCIEYLEAVPWEDSEEDEIISVVSRLGATTAIMPVLARIQPVDFLATKNVFISAVRFATSIDDGNHPPFGKDELRTSAREQVEYMLGDDDDEDMSLIAADDDVRLEAKMGLSKIFSSFETEISSEKCFSAEGKIAQSLSNLEWMCNISLKMGLMDDFVSKWIDTMSESVVRVIEDEKLESMMWGLKVKLIEVTSKVLDAVGYGNVILPAPQRVQLVKLWLPFVRKLKPILDVMIEKDVEFPYKMDEDLCQSIEGAMVSLVSALPSDDQAEILADWMNTEQIKYPDLSEAFEVWCFRTKSAKRRLVGGFERVDNATLSL